MNVRDLWLAKMTVDLVLYAARGVRKLVTKRSSPEPDPDAETSMPLSKPDTDYQQRIIRAGARKFGPNEPKVVVRCICDETKRVPHEEGWSLPDGDDPCPAHPSPNGSAPATPKPHPSDDP